VKRFRWLFLSAIVLSTLAAYSQIASNVSVFATGANNTFSAAVGTSAAAFTPTGDTAYPRAFHTATLLTNGEVLVAGGDVYEAYCLAGIASAELYSPAAGSFLLLGR
jgi:hypothetical protein